MKATVKAAMLMAIWWAGTAAVCVGAQATVVQATVVQATGAEAAKVEPTKSESAKETVKTVKAKTEKLNPSFEVKASVRAADAVELRYRPKVFSGELTIAAIAGHGQAVKKGDVILKLDAKNIDRQLAEAETALAMARAATAKEEFDAKAGEQADELFLRSRRQGLEQAELALKYFDEIDGPQMLARSDLNLKQWENSVGDQQDELDQLRKMYKSEELTSDTADIVVKRAVRQLEQTKVQQGFAIQGARKVRENEHKLARQNRVDDVERARQAMAAAEAQVMQYKVNRVGNLSNSRLALAAAEQRLADLRSDFENLTIKAPFDGNAYHGQWMSGGWGVFNGNGFTMNDRRQTRTSERSYSNAVLMTVAPKNQWLAIGDLPDSRRAEVEPGKSVEMAVAGRVGSSLKGEVVDLSATPKGNGQGWEVTVGIKSDKGEPLAYGTEVTVYFESPELNTLVVPVSAVKRGEVRVKKADGSEVERRLKLGATDGKKIQVLDGLEEGDEVVTP